MTDHEELEFLRKNYILKTLAHLKALEDLIFDDFKNPMVKADIAVRQVESSTSFMELCTFIIKLK